jgi:hypothetical protein
MVHGGAQCHQTGADDRQDAHLIWVSAAIYSILLCILSIFQPHALALKDLWLGSRLLLWKYSPLHHLRARPTNAEAHVCSGRVGSDDRALLDTIYTPSQTPLLLCWVVA